MIHGLKIWPEYFTEIVAGTKTFEIRKADRPFTEGDYLALNEWNPETEEYTGASVLVKVTYLWKDPKYVREGYVIMSIAPCSVFPYYQSHAPHSTRWEGSK